MKTRNSLVVVALCLLVPGDAISQSPVNTEPRLAGFSFLLRKPEFRKDMDIVDEQLADLEAIKREYTKFMTSNPAEMTPEDRRAYLATYQAREAEFQQRTEDVLLPHQRRRFAQIRLQDLIGAQGPTLGLTHPRMVEQIKLSDAQIEKIKGTADAMKAKLDETIEKLKREMADARNEARRTILGVLTAEQRRLYQDAVGGIADYSLVLALVPGNRVPRVASFTSLARKSEFRQDLEIVDEQYQEIQKIIDERTTFTRSNNTAVMTLEQRQTFLSTVNARMAEFEKRAEEVLLPHQKRRLGQLRLQALINAQGPTLGLTDKRMIEQIGLSDAQIEKITATADSANAKLKGKLETLERDVLMARQETRRVILGELTDEQRHCYHDAVGDIADYSLR